MTKINPTFDNSEVAISAVGFSSYSTKNMSDDSDKKGRSFTHSDILVRLRRLEQVVKNTDYAYYTKVLLKHIEDNANPHNVSLDQFTSEVATILYNEYVALGGTGSKDTYLKNLFTTLRLATLEDVAEGTDENCVISVALANQLIFNHATDLDAHSNIIDKVYPGEPVDEVPYTSFISFFGIPKECTTKVQVYEESSTVPYSYVNENGFVEYCASTDILPIDYSHGSGLFPCFGPRTNEMSGSNRFDLCTKTNVTLLAEAEMAPDKTNTATAVFLTGDISAQEHSLAVQNVTLDSGVAKTFSVFIKSESCRFVSFCYQDSTMASLTTVATFDLRNGYSINSNHMNRYDSNIVPLGNGYWRCEFNMLSSLGRTADLRMVFYNGVNDDLDMTFVGDGSIAAYVWGMQLEEGNVASPYIPTDGTQKSRNPIVIKQVLDTDWDSEYFTVNVEYKTPTNNASRVDKLPIVSGTNISDSSSFIVSQDADGSLTIRHYDNVTYSPVALTVYEDAFASSEEEYCSLTHVVGYDIIRTGFNDTVVTNNNKPAVMDTTTCLCIGHTNEAYFDGYIRSILLYKTPVTSDQITFLHSEQIYV